ESYIRKKGRLSVEEAQLIFGQAIKALKYAFEQGLIHRDIKPANFLLTTEDDKAVVKMIDFGLARMEDEEQFRVTKAGHTVGTIDYMAPEQARDSGTADVRSDIYSLGCTFYHMLAGQPPFGEGGLGERVYKHQSVDPPDVREWSPAVSDGLWELLK